MTNTNDRTGEARRIGSDHWSGSITGVLPKADPFGDEYGSRRRDFRELEARMSTTQIADRNLLVERITCGFMTSSRTTRIMDFSVPPSLATEVETLARAERRTKSELFREMVRVYQRYKIQRDKDDERWVANLIADAKTEQARHPMTPAQLLAEENRLADYGAAQENKLGIASKDVNRLIHEHRQSRKAPGPKA